MNERVCPIPDCVSKPSQQGFAKHICSTDHKEYIDYIILKRKRLYEQWIKEYEEGKRKHLAVFLGEKSSTTYICFPCKWLGKPGGKDHVCPNRKENADRFKLALKSTPVLPSCLREIGCQTEGGAGGGKDAQEEEIARLKRRLESQKKVMDSESEMVEKAYEVNIVLERILEHLRFNDIDMCKEALRIVRDAGSKELLAAQQKSFGEGAEVEISPSQPAFQEW